jgi:hypothetical protein
VSAITLVTYVWHYLVARLVYDQLVRPLLHGHPSTAVLTSCIGIAAFLIGRWSARRNFIPSNRPAGRRRP